MTASRLVIRLVATNNRGMRIGQYHQGSTLSDETVDRIREMHEDEGKGYKAIAKALGVKRSTVRAICIYRIRSQTYERWKKVVCMEKDDELVEQE